MDGCYQFVFFCGWRWRVKEFQIRMTYPFPCKYQSLHASKKRVQLIDLRSCITCDVQKLVNRISHVDIYINPPEMYESQKV